MRIHNTKAPSSPQWRQSPPPDLLAWLLKWLEECLLFCVLTDFLAVMLDNAIHLLPSSLHSPRSKKKEGKITSLRQFSYLVVRDSIASPSNGQSKKC
mmetsp:Transcript_62421/g.151949  ORF Transcript_62421/g.151949 Transcript_62421/m.151949 type:complete len:97 (-) Transcript_62421:535-825(-)